MGQFFKELAENRHVVIPVLAAIAVGILAFVFSLKLRRQLDAGIKSREEEMLSGASTVRAVRIESEAEMGIQGNPVYETGRKYYAHYEYVVDGKKYKYHAVTFVYPTQFITLAYHGNPKKAVWVNDIPKPAWYKPAVIALWFIPFAAALFTVFILGGAK